MSKRINLDGITYDLDITGGVAWLTVIGKRGRPTKSYRLARVVGGQLVNVGPMRRLP